jgi:hypothetical protein
LEDDGVWDEHVAIQLDPAEGFRLTSHSDAFVAINEQRVDQAILRNGDILALGSVKVRFSLHPVSLRSSRLREALTWIGLALLALGQIGLIYWLLE